jgi:hypothetical protein
MLLTALLLSTALLLLTALLLSTALLLPTALLLSTALLLLTALLLSSSGLTMLPTALLLSSSGFLSRCHGMQGSGLRHQQSHMRLHLQQLPVHLRKAALCNMSLCLTIKRSQQLHGA